MAPDMIRPATRADVDAIHGMVRELAEFEKLLHEVRSTPEHLGEALFGEKPALEALVAEGPEPGEPSSLVGFALYYPTFSSFTGRAGLWLEDLYVRPAHRGKGAGKALLDRFLQIARERGCGRAEWSVLDWNEGAIAFYEREGARILPDWRIARITDP